MVTLPPKPTERRNRRSAAISCETSMHREGLIAYPLHAERHDPRIVGHMVAPML